MLGVDGKGGAGKLKRWLSAGDLLAPGSSGQLVEEEKRMGLPPLEYLECYLDSPTFRENIAIYEKELEANSLKLKALLKECKRMIQATEDYSKSLTSFASVLGEFSFETEGSEKSEDEALLAESLQRFSETLMIIEESRTALITTMTHRLVKNLETFRKENIHNCREEKKKFERASERYYQALDRYLGMSQKKAMSTPEDKSDEVLVREMGAFRQASFQYVCMMQDIHAQKQYELMEPIIGYFSDISTFFHQAYDATSSMRPFVDRVQHKVQLLRDVYLEGQSKRYELKTSVLSKADEMISKHPDFKRQGHLLVHEKKGTVLQTGWVRYFCQFKKEEVEAAIIGHMKFIAMEGRGQLPRDFTVVKDCIRSKQDEADRRFCMELEIVLNKQEGLSKKYVVQAMNKEERKQWMDAMEGKEPIYLAVEEVSQGRVMTESAFSFVTKCIEVIEATGLDEEGLYRKPGQVNRAMKLMKDAVERRVIPPDLNDRNEWEIHIVCSAVKYFFSKQMGEPIMTYDLHTNFVDAAKLNDELNRIDAIKELIQQLPRDNLRMLKILMEHLSRVAAMSDQNLMKASNLGVCFGPTLMRPKHETVAAIADLKHESKVVEVLIDNVEEMFHTSEPAGSGVNVPEASSPRIPPRPSSTSDGPQTIEEEDEEGEIAKSFRGPARSGSVPVLKPLFHPPRSGSTKNSPSVPEQLSESPELLPSPPEVRPSSAPKYPLCPHPSRPPPPPPDKPPVSIVKQRSAVFSERSSTNGPSMMRKPVLPRNKPRVPPNERTKTRSPSTSSVSSEPAHLSYNRNNSASAILDDNRLADTTPGNETPKESTATVFESTEEKTVRRRSGEQPSMSPMREETRMVKLWNVGKRAVALYNCDSDDPSELSFKKNDYLLNVCSTDEDGWYEATLSSGQRGLVPCNYIKIVGEEETSTWPTDCEQS